MKTSSAVLVLLALLLLIPCTQALAATQPAPTPALAALATPAPVLAKADFLASLAADPAGKTCTSNAQCPAGQLCCYPCGRFGCTDVCTVVPPGGQCPHYP